MKKSFLLLAALSSFFVFGQLVGEINFDRIKERISDSQNQMYYPILYKRLLARDSTLNDSAYYHLYYGNIFQDYYHPYGATKKRKAFMTAFGIEENYLQLLQQGQELLAENPVDLEVLLNVIFLCSKIGQRDLAVAYAKIYVSFLEVIYNSGDGKTCESAFVVIAVDDEYRIATDLGLTVVKQFLIGECDQLIFQKKGQKKKNRINELYFNVRMPLTHLSNAYNKSDLPDPDPDPDEE